ncbi:MAG: hypothetical protein ACREX3_05870 [Gammaproteobacteria bacterium]
MSRVEVELAAVEETSARRDSGVAGLLNRRGDTLIGYCWLPAIGIESLLILLSTGRRVTIALDSRRLRYRKALVYDVNWWTIGHPELEAEFEDIHSLK